MTARLAVEHLTCRFGARDVVRDVSLEIAAGEVVCLLGPSGCGKSTTLRAIAGIEEQRAGRITLDGRVLAEDGLHLPPEERSIGLIFQDFALFPHLSVWENIAFGLSGTRAEKVARVGALLERVRLTGFQKARPHTLSGGEQQRVALARALAPKPAVMLMDEPFSGLDNRLRDGIRDDTLALLQEEDTAVLLVTHEPEEAMRMADRIALMRDGEIVQQGAPYAIYTAPADRDAAAFFSDINILEGKVEAGFAQTILGPFAAPDLSDGQVGEVVFRPQHVAVDFDRDGGPRPSPLAGTPVPATVRRARFIGQQSLIEFALDGAVTPVLASLPGVFLPRPGTRFWLSLRRDRAFVFAKRP
ncbi:MAG: ABC transporter ATP-binding protein [Pseudomonadota bacterium]